MAAGAALCLALRLASAAPVEAVSEPGRGGVFRDVAAETGLEFVHFNGMTGDYAFAEIIGSGAGLLDYDGDGDLDVYLVQGDLLEPEASMADALFPHPGPPGDRLFRNDLWIDEGGVRRLRFVDVTERAGLNGAVGQGMGVATGDVDNDGWTDLYVTRLGPNQLWRNNRDGTFADVTAASGADDRRWSVSASFADVDNDGWLDLFVGNYVRYNRALDAGCTGLDGARDYCAPLVFEPEPDRLLVNRGDGTFEDASSTAGIQGAAGRALGVLASDFDGDGRVDLYVANDMTENFLWMNRGDGTFEDDALLAGCALNWEGLAQASMGIDAADMDDDGDEDLFMTHLKGETNTLYLNDGDGVFRDVTLRSGLGTPSWSYTAFGTRWIDYDNDGRLDLAIVNGAVKKLEELVRAGDPHPVRQPDQLFRNLGEGRFADVSAESGDLARNAEASRGAAFGDLDNDGDVDLVVSHNAGKARLLLNGVGQDRAWIGLRPLAAAGGPAVGARAAVELEGAGRRWGRSRSDGSYASAHDPRLLFGLGDRRGLGVRLYWPRGGATVWAAPPGGRYLVLQRAPTRGGSPALRSLDPRVE